MLLCCIPPIFIFFRFSITFVSDCFPLVYIPVILLYFILSPIFDDFPLFLPIKYNYFTIEVILK